MRPMEKQVKIHDLEVKYRVSHRDVRYPRLEFKTGSLLLILPKNYQNEQEIIRRHRDWIYKKTALIKNSLEDMKIKEKNLEPKKTDQEFKHLVHSLVKGFSRELKININRIFFRRMKSKWASLSSRKNLTINTLSKYLPENLIEYIVLHEMTHVIERKHSEKFWKTVIKKCRDYQKYESDLLAYWFLIQQKKENQNN